MIKQLLFLSLYLSISAAYGQNNSTLDSLTFRHEKSGKEVQIKKGMTIDIITKDKETITGKFVRHSADKIIIKDETIVRTFELSEIKKIVVFQYVHKDPITRSLRFLAIEGTSLMSYMLGGTSIVTGILLISSHTTAGIVLIGIGLPLVYAGYKIKKQEQRTIKMNKRWKIAS